MNNKIDEELGVLTKALQQIPWEADEQSEIEVIPSPSQHLENDGSDIEKDYEYQRNNFYNLVEKGSAAIDGILELAKESEHPRTYEVAGILSNKSQKLPKNWVTYRKRCENLKKFPIQLQRM